MESYFIIDKFQKEKIIQILQFDQKIDDWTLRARSSCEKQKIKRLYRPRNLHDSKSDPQGGSSINTPGFKGLI